MKTDIKRPPISEAVEIKIAKLFREGFKPPEIKKILGRYPSLRAIETRVQSLKLKGNSEKYRELESPWHIGATPDMPSEAVNKILEVQQQMSNWLTHPVRENDPMIVNVREAKWVARLYAVKGLRKLNVLIEAVLAYSWREWLSDVVPSIPVDTCELDHIIAQPNVEKGLISYMERYEISKRIGKDMAKDGEK